MLSRNPWEVKIPFSEILSNLFYINCISYKENRNDWENYINWFCEKVVLMFCFIGFKFFSGVI